MTFDHVKDASDRLLRLAVLPDGRIAAGLHLHRHHNRTAYEIAAGILSGAVRVDRQGAYVRLMLTTAGRERLGELLQEKPRDEPQEEPQDEPRQ